MTVQGLRFIAPRDGEDGVATANSPETSMPHDPVSNYSGIRSLGGCLCGAVRLEISAAPLRVGVCHCLDCRKRQGAIFHTFAVFPRDAVTVTGETRAYQTRHFCPTCGSPLFDIFGNELELHLGCLDAPSRFTPTYECWTIRREAWLPPFEGMTRFERDRAMGSSSGPGNAPIRE